MEIKPLSPALGAEIIGLDASAPLDEGDTAALLSAYDEYKLLVLRDQHLDADEQEEFASLFGPPIDDGGDGRRTGFISNVLPGGAGEGPLPFHSDLVFTPYPVQGIALYAMELPPQGTSTWFANAALAARTLPDDLRSRADGRECAFALSSFVLGRDDAKAREHDLGPDATRHRHPVLRRHPRTGEEVLFVSDLHAERIEGMDNRSGRALIEQLLDHLYSEQHLYEHHWSLNDLAIWDNQALQHMRHDIGDAKPRTFRRNSLNTARWVELVPVAG
jgi:taurine dioxygenase